MRASEDDLGVLAVAYLEQWSNNQLQEEEVCILASANEDKVHILAVTAFK